MHLDQVSRPQKDIIVVHHTPIYSQLTEALSNRLQLAGWKDLVRSRSEDGAEYIEIYTTYLHSIIDILDGKILICCYDRQNHRFISGTDCLSQQEMDYCVEFLQDAHANK